MRLEGPSKLMVVQSLAAFLVAFWLRYMMTNRWFSWVVFVLVTQVSAVVLGQPPETERPRTAPRSPQNADFFRRLEEARAQAEGVAAPRQESSGQASRGASVSTQSLRDLPAEVGQTLSVKFTEFRLPAAIDGRLTAGEIEESFERLMTEGKVELIECVTLSTIESQETMVRFGKRVAVTTGVVVMPGAGARNIRNVQNLELGTIVRVKAESRGEQVVMNLNYESSRLVGEGAEDAPPDTHSIELTSTLLLELGVPKLVGGTTADGTSFLIAEVAK